MGTEVMSRVLAAQTAMLRAIGFNDAGLRVLALDMPALGFECNTESMCWEWPTETGWFFVVRMRDGYVSGWGRFPVQVCPDSGDFDSQWPVFQGARSKVK